MIKMQRAAAVQGSLEIENIPVGMNASAIAEALGLPGSVPAKTLLAADNGHRFEVVEATVTEPVEHSGGRTAYVNLYKWPSQRVYEYAMVIHFPVDPRLIREDVAIATRADGNADGTAWLFYPPSDEDAMVDHEDALAGGVISRFASHVNAAQIKVNEATNATVKGQAVDIHTALVAFQEAVTETVITEARTKPKGWYEANPHEAHVHVPIRRGIEAVTATWQTDRAMDYLSLIHI